MLSDEPLVPFARQRPRLLATERYPLASPLRANDRNSRLYLRKPFAVELLGLVRLGRSGSVELGFEPRPILSRVFVAYVVGNAFAGQIGTVGPTLESDHPEIARVYRLVYSGRS